MDTWSLRHPFNQPIFFGLDRNERYKIEYSVSKPSDRPFVKTLNDQYISLSDACEVPQVSRKSETEISRVDGQVSHQLTVQAEVVKRKNPIWKQDMATHLQEITRQVDYFAHIEAQLRIDQADLKKDVQNNYFKTKQSVQKHAVVIRSIPGPKLKLPTQKASSATHYTWMNRVGSLPDANFRCAEHPVDWLDQLTSQDLKKATFCDSFAMEAEVLEPKVTSTNEDNLFHCLFGEKEPFRCDNPAEKRAKLITSLQNLARENSDRVKPFLLHFLTDIEGLNQTPDLINCYQCVMEREASNVKALTEVLVKNGSDVGLKNLADSTSIEDLLTFIDKCECAATLKEIASYLVDQKIDGDGEYLLNRYINYLGNQWQRLRLSDLPLLSRVFRLKIVVYREAKNNESGECPFVEVDAFQEHPTARLSILMKSDGTFQRLEKNPKLLDFYDLKGFQSRKHYRLLRYTANIYSGLLDKIHNSDGF